MLYRGAERTFAQKQGSRWVFYSIIVLHSEGLSVEELRDISKELEKLLEQQASVKINTYTCLIERFWLESN